jgi:hypothetical protein
LRVNTPTGISLQHWLFAAGVMTINYGLCKGT